MSKTFFKMGLLSMAALVPSGSLKANALSVHSGSNVLRVDLERKIVNHYDNIQLEERTDINLIIDSPTHKSLDEEEAVMIDSDQLNYSQLRELQRRKAQFDIKKAEGNQLAQSKQKSASGLNA